MRLVSFPFFTLFIIFIDSVEMKQFSSMLDSVTTKVKSFNQTPLEKKVSEATSNENWGVANSALIELARETNDFNNFAVIMKGIWEGLADKKEKWRRIYKALVLLEYCLKYGSERVCNEARSEVYKIRPLQDFKHMEEGRDKGMGIRDKAKAVADLLGDAEQLKAERAKATETRRNLSVFPVMVRKPCLLATDLRLKAPRRMLVLPTVHRNRCRAWALTASPTPPTNWRSTGSATASAAKSRSVLPPLML